ncbi:MAG: ComF family protein [Candidatus Omnitrophota bacterium]
MHNLLISCVNILFSSDCPACGGPRGTSISVICPACEHTIASGKAPPPACSEHISLILSCRYYTGVVRNTIKQFKYGRKQRMARAFEDIIRLTSRSDNRFGALADLIIPVPIHWRKRHARGFNQAEVIAKTLSGTIAVPVSANNLIKIKNTPPQITRTKPERMRNLTGSFAVRQPSSGKNKTILLVDDVMTTGATLDTCAAELLSSGAKEIYAFTLARTPGKSSGSRKLWNENFGVRP